MKRREKSETQELSIFYGQFLITASTRKLAGVAIAVHITRAKVLRMHDVKIY